MDEHTLRRLGEFLNDNLSLQTCNSAFDHTELWLIDQGVEGIESEIKWLEDSGANCDCEVVLRLYLPLREEEASGS